jgi:hypothetical protein
MPCSPTECRLARFAQAYSGVSENAVDNSRAVLMLFLACVTPLQCMVQIFYAEDHEHDDLKPTHQRHRSRTDTRITRLPSQETKWPRR